jgi:hypothetical protein
MLLGQNLGGADARRWPLSPLLSVLEASVALLRSWIPTAQPTDTGAETETNAERTQVCLSTWKVWSAARARALAFGKGSGGGRRRT